MGRSTALFGVLVAALAFLAVMLYGCSFHQRPPQLSHTQRVRLRNERIACERIGGVFFWYVIRRSPPRMRVHCTFYLE